MTALHLPSDISATLRRARQIETLATNLDQRRRAVAGTAALMLAAVDAGWPIVIVAQATGLRYGAAKARIRAARHRYSDDRPALVLDEPLRPRKPLELLKQPTSAREWLTLHEASAHTGRSLETVRQWRRRGLLPNTHTVAPTRMLYLRADLDRVLAAPTYRPGRVDQAALREHIARSPV